MGRVIVANWVTLDGVMQGPGAPDEDTRDGFSHSGWAAPYTAPAMGEAMGARMAGGFAWLLGRRTYEQLLDSWNRQGGPFRDALNQTPKFVVSRDRSTHLAHPQSTLLAGDAATEVSELKHRRDDNLIVMGSGELIAALVGADLIDEYLLFIAPLVLGVGRRLFPPDIGRALTLTEAAPTPTGALIAAYAAVA